MSNSLENLQRYVGGHVETVTFAADMCVICDEEGRLKGKPYNCTVCGVDFVGDILLVGVKGTEFADLPISFERAKGVLRSLWND